MMRTKMYCAEAGGSEAFGDLAVAAAADAALASVEVQPSVRMLVRVGYHLLVHLRTSLELGILALQAGGMVVTQKRLAHEDVP